VAGPGQRIDQHVAAGAHPAKPDRATDGGEISSSSQWPESTVLSTVISTRAEQFIADAPGDWKLRCHMTHTT
jgi:hypothetical protein